MIKTVKIDKLSFSVKVDSDTSKMIKEIVEQYYEKFQSKYAHNKLLCEVTPTKQNREGYMGYNHNLQMIPLEEFCKFLKRLREVAGQDLDVHRIDLAKDVLLRDEVKSYLDTLLDHEYLNGYIEIMNCYILFKMKTYSFESLNIEYNKNLSSNKHKPKLLIKCYDKATQLIDIDKANRVLPLKELVEIPELPMGYSTGGDRYGLFLYQINLFRCELELRNNNLPYHTIDQIIKAIEDKTFQDTVETKYNSILSNTIFAEPKQTSSSRSLKSIAVELMRKSDRNYKLLFVNAGMRKEYNYFKKAKEVKIRENDLNFEELRKELLNE